MFAAINAILITTIYCCIRRGLLYATQYSSHAWVHHISHQKIVIIELWHSAACSRCSRVIAASNSLEKTWLLLLQLYCSSTGSVLTCVTDLEYYSSIIGKTGHTVKCVSTSSSSSSPNNSALPWLEWCRHSNSMAGYISFFQNIFGVESCFGVAPR